MPNLLGVNTWTWVSPLTTERLADLCPKVRDMGFDIIELPIEDPSHIDAATAKSLLEEYGLSATVCGAFGPSRDLAADESEPIENSIAYITEIIRIAATVGASVVAGPMYSAVGKARQVPRDVRNAEFDRAVAGLKRAGAIAVDSGITLAIEPLNRFETDMINTAAQARAMVDAVGHPNVKIHLDTFHMNIEEDDVFDAILLAGADLAHVHASESNRGTPGNGLAAWADLKRGIDAVGYSGPVVIETFTPEVKEIAKAAAIWRPLAASQDDLARDGLAFLRGLLGV